MNIQDLKNMPVAKLKEIRRDWAALRWNASQMRRGGGDAFHMVEMIDRELFRRERGDAAFARLDRPEPIPRNPGNW